MGPCPLNPEDIEVFWRPQHGSIGACRFGDNSRVARRGVADRSMPRSALDWRSATGIRVHFLSIETNFQVQQRYTHQLLQLRYFAINYGRSAT